METEKTNRPKKIGTAIKLLYISLGIGTVQVILSAFTHVPKLSTISIILGVFILIGPMWLFIQFGGVWGSSLRLTFEDITFNMFEAVFKFSILLQLCFHACNRAADRTVLV